MNADCFSPQRHRDDLNNLAMDDAGHGTEPRSGGISIAPGVSPGVSKQKNISMLPQARAQRSAARKKLTNFA